MEVDVSIIIVNWNARDDLRNCICSTIEQTKKSYEIIVVDNASMDGSAEMISAEFPSVTLIANNDNKGFAAANNQALALASGRFFLLLNPDTIVLDGAIDKVVDWHSTNEDVGCVGCQIYETETKIQKTSFKDPGPLNLLFTEFGLLSLVSKVPFLEDQEYTNWDRKSEKEVDVVSGMFMLLPRTVIEEVGQLDDAFFIYAEEADLCRRIRSAGYRCVYSTVARVIHVDGGGKSTSQIKPRMYVQLQKSLLIYNRKHYRYAGYLFVKLMFITSKTLRLAVFGLLTVLSRNDQLIAKRELARVSLLFHILGKSPS